MSGRLTVFVLSLVLMARAADRGLISSDLYKLRSVGEVELSPDGTRIAYSVTNSDQPGRQYSQLFILSLDTMQSVRLGGEHGRASGARWSPDGRWLACIGGDGQNSGLMIAHPDGSGATFLAPVSGTNHPLPSSGERIAWSPDGKQIAFLSTTPGPELDLGSDPLMITRYLYKPTASEGMTRFNDNRRQHIFLVDIASRAVRQLTKGNYYEHSIAWSPGGADLLFISNHEPDPDRFFNYDIFSLNVADGVARALTSTKNAEYHPEWSPDGKTIVYLGTKRPLTSSETTMEDTHVWFMNADGSNRHEAGGDIDNRQGAPHWSPDGNAVYFTVQERGSTHLYRLPMPGGAPQLEVGGRGSVGSWSVGKGDMLAFGHRAVVFETEGLHSARGSARYDRFAWRLGAAGPCLSSFQDLVNWHALNEAVCFLIRHQVPIDINESLAVLAHTLVTEKVAEPLQFRDPFLVIHGNILALECNVDSSLGRLLPDVRGSVGSPRRRHTCYGREM